LVARHERLDLLARVRSFDDGARWQRIPVLRIGELALGLVVHQRGATHVSLRGSAKDAAGNEVEQTLVRAYRLGK